MVSRWTLLAAAWTVTKPYDTDVAPSGTASVEMARLAGIPEQYAGGDPDAVPATMAGGAPSPLQAAIQGRTPSQYEPEGRHGERAGTTIGTSLRAPHDSGCTDGGGPVSRAGLRIGPTGSCP